MAETYTATQVVMLFLRCCPDISCRNSNHRLHCRIDHYSCRIEGQREALIPTLGIFGVASLRILPLAA